MTRIVHISDLHFGRSRPVLCDRLLARINPSSTDLVVVSGDLTQRATSRQYHQASRFLKQLTVPVLVIPGNHDLSIHRLIQRFTTPWKKWRQFITDDLEPVIESDDFIVIGLNTVRILGHRLNWTRGRINDLQLNRLEHRLRQTADHKIRIITAHHPFWLPPSESGRQLVGSGKKAFEKLKSLDVDMILGGHTHLGYIRLKQGLMICHSGTTLSSRTKHSQANSYNYITGDRHTILVQKMEWQGHDFKPVEARAFKKNRRDWNRVDSQ